MNANPTNCANQAAKWVNSCFETQINSAHKASPFLLCLFVRQSPDEFLPEIIPSPDPRATRNADRTCVRYESWERWVLSWQKKETSLLIIISLNWASLMLFALNHAAPARSLTPPPLKLALPKQTLARGAADYTNSLQDVCWPEPDKQWAWTSDCFNLDRSLNAFTLNYFPFSSYYWTRGDVNWGRDLNARNSRTSNTEESIGEGRQCYDCTVCFRR